ncbi:HAD family hydrolase [Paraburkholderia oxyphila]|uniref:HAD family hydrolase n=1 Tax=Paraburkholderia oxyphila TaxID=614212 RepID=UPI000AD34CE6|nr:hypothetical protein [Paraburkholderia oxyphila]
MEELVSDLRRVSDSQLQTIRQLEAERGELAVRIHMLESSTFWRMTGPLRRTASRMSPNVVFALRRTAKLIWWTITPHRIPARLRFIAARRKGIAESLARVSAVDNILPRQSQNVSPAGLESHFDGKWYIAEYPEVVASGMDPLQHYLAHGWREGKNPNPLFDVRWYLESNPSLREQCIEPLGHFLSVAAGAVAPCTGNSLRGWPLSADRFGQVPEQFPAHYGPVGRIVAHGIPDEVFLSQLDDVDVVSFDIFDTALVRKVAHPTSVFDLLQFRFPHLRTSENFGVADVRFWAEREARERAQRLQGTVEIGIDDIYAVLGEALSIKGAELNALRDAELDIERSVLVANPKVLGWYSEAKRAGKRVIFVSDMYLPSEFLASVLVNQGFEGAQVYVSCEYGVGKGQRQLFEKVRLAWGIPAQKFLHTGDNFHSDKVSAEAMGWRAIHFVEAANVQPYAQQLIDTTGINIGNPSVSIGLGLSHAHRLGVEASNDGASEKLAKHIGYEILGPTILGFTGWLGARAKRAGLSKILFLARDGWLPAKTYERIQSHAGLSAEGHYVLASRRLLYSNNLRPGRDVANAIRSIGYSKGTTLAEYLDIFHVTADEAQRCGASIGISDVHAPIERSFGADLNYREVQAKLADLIKAMAPIVLERAGERRAALRDYYEGVAGLRGTGKVGLVDFGWAGSLLEPLEAILKEIDPALQVSAYFFGLNTRSNSVIPGSINASSYFFDRKDCAQPQSPLVLPNMARPQDVVGASLSLLEVLVSANNTTVVDLSTSSNGKGFSVTYAEDSYSPAQRRFLETAHEACLRFVDDALPFLPRNAELWDLKPLIAQGWQRLLSSPESSEAAYLGAFPHRVDASGHAANTTLVSLPDPGAGAESLWDEFQRAMWPAGWFALLDPAARATMLGSWRK